MQPGNRQLAPAERSPTGRREMTTLKQAHSLWRNRAFTRLWVAHVTSGAGAAITSVALPLTAVLLLGASPSQMGLLAAAGSLPNLLFGLVAGVWVDRVPRRPILVWSDIGRALLLASVPAAASLGRLTFLQLWLVTFAAGTLTVFFQIAAISLLPALVEKRALVDANSRLSTSEALISIAGPCSGRRSGTIPRRSQGHPHRRPFISPLCACAPRPSRAGSRPPR